MTATTDLDHHIARLRRTLLLLAHNQPEQQQRAAAGRHLAALGAALVRQGQQRQTRHQDEEGR